MTTMVKDMLATYPAACASTRAARQITTGQTLLDTALV